MANDAPAPASATPAPSRGTDRRARVTRFGFWVVVVAIAVATRWWWCERVAVQAPAVQWDTQVFQQIADQPLSFDLVVSSKPPIVPLVYRAANNDLGTVVEIQAELSFWAWAALAASLAFAMQRRWVQLIAIGVGAALVLDPTRVGFTGALIPESINDSLLALCIAGVLAMVRLAGRARLAVALATSALALAWLFTRDANALVAMTAAVMALVLWRGWRARAASALVLVAAGVVLWSTSVSHAPLPYQRAWYPAFTARGAYPMLDNLIKRVRVDQPAEVPPPLRPFDDAMPVVVGGPELRPLQAELTARGTSIYVRWLLRHPVARVIEVIEHRWVVLAGNMSAYMPQRWAPSARAPTSNRWVLQLLLLACPLLLWRLGASPLRRALLCIVVSALVGIMASYYGDAVELARHCYGAGQQLVLGMFIALVGWLDRERRAQAPARSMRRNPR